MRTADGDVRHGDRALFYCRSLLIMTDGPRIGQYIVCRFAYMTGMSRNIIIIIVRRVKNEQRARSTIYMIIIANICNANNTLATTQHITYSVGVYEMAGLCDLSIWTPPGGINIATIYLYIYAKCGID